ncbi:MAG: hypothetical protein ACM3ZV_12815 [Bacillota bacterium]
MTTPMSSQQRRSDSSAPKGLRLFLDDEQQAAWLEGSAAPEDGERPHSDDLEQRFKYAHRFEKLLRLPQAQDVLDILRLYAATAIPIPCTTERFYWSVSCLPDSPDRPLARVNASWMELFALLPDSPSALAGEGLGRGGGAGGALRARFILHLSDFTADGSPDPDAVDTALLESMVERPEDVSHAVWRNGREILIAKVRTAASIRAFLAHPHGLRAIRRFNLTHMNRGRNAYQASHCYSLADAMLGD